MFFASVVQAESTEDVSLAVLFLSVPPHGIYKDNENKSRVNLCCYMAGFDRPTAEQGSNRAPRRDVQPELCSKSVSLSAVAHTHTQTNTNKVLLSSGYLTKQISFSKTH